MKPALVLPRLTGFSLSGFQPIFSADVHVDVSPGPNVILGGNGLGKTTLMQAVVYGLTGGVTEAIEEDKRLRWGHSYFRSRLSTGKAAHVEVAFRLGKEQVAVRRGFAGSLVTGVKATSLGSRWIEGADAPKSYERVVCRRGGYRHIDDFCFLVNRLLYLPESRRLLAWDTDAHTRVLMLVNHDVIAEQEFREQREQLTFLDSRKRHTHVVLVKAATSLLALEETDGTSPESQPQLVPEGQRPEDVASLLDELSNMARIRADATASLLELEQVLTKLAGEVEALQTELERTEAGLVANLLEAAEREANLALHKLLENGICPSCGTYQTELQSAAKQYQRQHRCYLCGSEQAQETSQDLVQLRSRLAEQLAALRVNEQAYIVVEQRVNQARRIESDLQTKLNAVRFQQPILNLPDEALPTSAREDLERRKRQLQAEEADLDIQIRELQSVLDREYAKFLAAVSQRLESLRKTYEGYATAFLGVPCKLATAKESDRLFGLTAFVPEFGGSVRETPDSCSEAQRFFLDIAFRMALLDIASDLADSPGTFMCETPETALDVSYVDNVVLMFKRFSAGEHSLIFTANLQEHGIAQKVMASVPKKERPRRVLSLLRIGQLTTVHLKALAKLTRLAQKVVE